jgi:DNA transformation protein and related proteins
MSDGIAALHPGAPECRTMSRMSVSGSYLAFVLEQLAGVRGVVTRRMFGGVGIYSGEAFFAIIDNDTVFFKVDEALAAQYRNAGMPPFTPIPGKPPMLGYYQVPVDVLEDAEAMTRWAKQSIQVAVRVPARRRPSRARRPGRTTRRRK